jgi:hypothetical protein
MDFKILICIRMIIMKKNNVTPGFRYNTTYMGNQVKDNSLKPSVPKFSIGKARRNIVSKYSFVS